MDQKRAPEYGLEVIADRSTVKDVVKGVIHTIFFHRLFNPLHPATHDVLDTTLPYISDPELETLLEHRLNTLIRQLDHPNNSSNPPTPHHHSHPTRNHQILVQFLEKKRRKSGWFVAKADEETVWETWVVDVILTSSSNNNNHPSLLPEETTRNRHHHHHHHHRRQQIETSLQQAALQILTVVNRDRDHIPVITDNSTNPFPYQVLVNPKSDGWGAKMGIF